MFSVKGRIIILSVGSWRQHLSFPLFVLPLEPCDWPQRQSVSFWAGLEPAVAALVQWRKDSCSQRRSKEGKKNIQCVSSGHSFPKSQIYWPSLPETNMAWKDPWKISAKLSGVTRSGGLSCRCLEVFGCLPVVGPRRWRRRLSPRSGVPVCPAPCKT